MTALPAGTVPSWRGPGSVADRASLVLFGGGALAVVGYLATRTGPLTDSQLIGLPLLFGLYILAYRTQFDHLYIMAVPTEPVLVAMLFVLPLPIVPAVVIAAQLLAVPSEFRGQGNFAKMVALRLCDGWHCIGPVLVLWTFGPHHPELVWWPVYLLALAAQFLLDGLVGAIREYLLIGTAREVLTPMIWTFAIDTALAVIAICAVITAGGSLWTVALAAVPVALLRLLIQDRQIMAVARKTLDAEVVTAREEARVDPLTGLGNRRAWFEALTAAEAMVGDGNSRFEIGVLLADLNELKLTNDTLGHEVGDELIVAMADALRESMPTAGTLCRTGGDEFAVLILARRGGLDLPASMTRLRSVMVGRSPRPGLVLAAGIGACVCPPATSVADAVRTADEAVYQDKRAGRPDRRVRSSLPRPRVESDPPA